MAETNAWASVAPIRPREAEVELGFLFLDIAQDEEPNQVAYVQKMAGIINGLYIAGWRDAREDMYRRMLGAE